MWKKTTKKPELTIKKRYLCYRRDLTSKAWFAQIPPGRSVRVARGHFFLGACLWFKGVRSTSGGSFAAPPVI